MPSCVARDQSANNLYITATVVEAEQRTKDRRVLNLTNSHRIYKTSAGKNTHFIILLPKDKAVSLLDGKTEVFVALETERLCKFVSLVMFVPGEHYISGALQAQSSSAYSSSTDEG